MRCSPGLTSSAGVKPLLLIVIALLLSVPFQASSYRDADADGDGWYDDPVDEDRYRYRTYPRYRPQPYYEPRTYDPEPQPLDTMNARCDADYRAYLQSLDCYNRFRYHNGTMRPEAYHYCGTPVLDPSPNCGPPRNWR